MNQDLKEKIMRSLPIIIFLFFVFGPALGKNFFVLLILIFLGYLFINRLKTNPSFGSRFKFKPKGYRSRVVDVDLNDKKIMENLKHTIIAAVLIIFGAWLFFASIVIIDAGETGVYSLFGKVRDNELRSGFHLVIPLAKVTRMSIRTEEYTMSIAQGEGKRYSADAITSLTKEGLSVDLDMTVLYHLNEEKASDIYREVGEDYSEKIIRPTIRTVIRDVIAQYEAKDIYSEKREEAAAKISDKLARDLEGRGIIVENVLLRNIALPANLANAIQEKLQAEQEAQKYDFILQKEEKEKERKIIEAEGQRDAQKIINESLSTNYLYYLYISGLKDREGTIYVPTGTETGMPMFRSLGN